MGPPIVSPWGFPAFVRRQGGREPASRAPRVPNPSPSRAALTALAALAAPLPAHADGPTPTGEQVGIKWQDMTVDFGDLHLSANLLGYELASPCFLTT